MDNMLQFDAIIEIIGVNPYVLVTADKAETLQPGWRKPMPVTVQVNGQPVPPWHINMMPVGSGDFYLYLHNDVRKVSQTQVGDHVTVRVWFDDAYVNGPMHAMPKLFERELRDNPAAAKRWEALPPSMQKEVLRYLAGLKSEVALERNIQKAIRVLLGSDERFLGRTWADEGKQAS